MIRFDALPYTNASLPTHCPVTGLPIYGHSSWVYTSPGGKYRLRVSFIGDRIVWLQAAGYVRLEYAQAGMALLEDVLFSMMPKASPFIAIDDYSAVRGATLNARRFIIQTLRQERRMESYIVYGPAPVFRLGLGLSRRFNVFPFEVVITRNYDEAVTAAHARSGAPGAHSEEGLHLPRSTADGEIVGGDPPARHPGDPLAPYADELLDIVGRITLEPYGMAPVSRTVPLDHPLRPVHDALALLRDDMQAILRRLSEARAKVDGREKELMEKQTMLNETHTTLNVLFQARQEERRRFEARIKNRFQALLQPLVEGIESTVMTPRQRELIQVLHQVFSHIGGCLMSEEQPVKTAFTPRERLIACLLILGKSPQAIARLLELSPRTVENHCQRMRAKIGLVGPVPTLQDWLARQTSTGFGKTEGGRP
jgi:DNA-binding CsgD family transcriptional regulator